MIFVLLVLGAVVLQSTALSRLTFFGVAPDLVVMLVITIALMEGPIPGAVSGFAAGLMIDFPLETPTGLTGLAYLAVGYLTGIVRPYVQPTAVLFPVIAVGIGSLISGTLFATLLFLFGGQPDPIARVVRVVLLTAVYNTMLTPLVYPVIRRVLAIYPSDKVQRW